MEAKSCNNPNIQYTKKQNSANQHYQKPRVFRIKTSQHSSNINERSTIINSMTHKKQSSHQYSKLHQSKILNQDVILVYLMYKKQKFSIFLQKGTPLQYLLKMLYKQIYQFQKQTYSISNTIIKQIMMKISGFQTLDNDLKFNFCLKKGIGNIQSQKFITPLISQSNSMPIKIYKRVQQKQMGIEYLCRNFNNGQYYILTSIKKMNLIEDQKNKILKQLKNINYSIESYLHRTNYFQTQKHIFLLRQNQVGNLKQYIQYKSIFDENQIFSIIYSILLTLAKLNQGKLGFKNLTLNDFIIDNQGHIKVSVFLIYRQKIQNRHLEKQYFVFLNQLLSSMMKQKSQSQLTQQFSSSFLQFKNLVQKNSYESQSSNFNQLILQNWVQQKIIQKQNSNISLQIKLSQQYFVHCFSQIIEKKQYSQEGETLNQLKQQIRSFYSEMNIKLKQHSKQIFQFANNIHLHYHHETLQAKQTIKNFQQLNKQIVKHEDYLHLNKTLVNQIINQFNKNQIYISQIKKNNIASIQFYLQKSEKQKQFKMLSQIKQKYKKYLKKELKGNFTFKEQDETNQQFKQENKENNKTYITTFNPAKKSQKKTMVSYFSTKSKTTQTKRIASPNRIKQLFVDQKSIFKKQKNKLKRKQYEIYLLQAQKQYNKIKVYKHQAIVNS